MAQNARKCIFQHSSFQTFSGGACLRIPHRLILVSVVLKHPLVIRGIGLLSGGISLALTHIFARGRHSYTHALMAAMINSSYRSNGNSAGPKYGCFHSSSWATNLYTKNEWGVSRFPFPTLLDFLRELLLYVPTFQYDDICGALFILFRDFGKQNTRGNVSKISVSLRVRTHWTDKICFALPKFSTKFVSAKFSICETWAH